MTHRPLVSVLLAVACSGCSLFTPPIEKPIISDNLGITGVFKPYAYETLATTADRRVILVKPDTAMFCAEPSPDAIVTLASSIGAQVKGNRGDVTGSLELARSLAAAPRAISYRSQGLLLFRDAAFTYCQARLNNTITEAEYAQRMDRLLSEVLPLIDKEISLLPQIYKDKSAGASTATATTVIESDSLESKKQDAGDVKKESPAENSATTAMQIGKKAL